MYQKSHLTRGAWIEIVRTTSSGLVSRSRTSHEVRGLKCGVEYSEDEDTDGRTSHEVRGLKYCLGFLLLWTPNGRTSHEVRGLK